MKVNQFAVESVLCLVACRIEWIEGVSESVVKLCERFDFISR